MNTETKNKQISADELTEREYNEVIYAIDTKVRIIQQHLQEARKKIHKDAEFDTHLKEVVLVLKSAKTKISTSYYLQSDKNE